VPVVQLPAAWSPICCLTSTSGVVPEVTEQLELERARSCRNAITMCSGMVDEIRLRAHARPLDEAEGDIAN